MMLARVIGNVVCTIKYPALEGYKLLLIQPITKEGKPRGRPLVAIDAVGAGYRETVYWCRGREASLAFKGEVPTEASIVGIVDTITVPGAGPNPVPAANLPAKAKNDPARKPRKGR